MPNEQNVSLSLAFPMWSAASTYISNMENGAKEGLVYSPSTLDMGKAWMIWRKASKLMRAGLVCLEGRRVNIYLQWSKDRVPHCFKGNDSRKCQRATQREISSSTQAGDVTFWKWCIHSVVWRKCQNSEMVAFWVGICSVLFRLRRSPHSWGVNSHSSKELIKEGGAIMSQLPSGNQPK